MDFLSRSIAYIFCERILFSLAAEITKLVHLDRATISKIYGCGGVNVQVDFAAKLAQCMEIQVVNNKTKEMRLHSIKFNITCYLSIVAHGGYSDMRRLNVEVYIQS